MSDDSTLLLLIRHAHVDTGPDGGRLCGWFDPPLSSQGEEQLNTFEREAPHSPPAALYASSLIRAAITAHALARRWSLAATIDDSLREIHCGEFEGRPIRDLKRQHPKIWTRNAAQLENDFAWPGGETYQNFRNRIVDALTRIAVRHPNQRVAIVTHTGAITQAIGALEGRSPAEWEHHRARPFSATELVWSARAPQRLLSFNVENWWRESPRLVE